MRRIVNSWARRLRVVAMVALGMVVVAPVSATVIVSAGSATGIANDWDAFINGVIIFGEGAPTNNTIHVKLDLGVPKKVNTIIHVNRTNATTLLNPFAANIWVAADESSLTFNPNNPATYSIKIFDGLITPTNFNIGVARQTGFGTGVYWERRYFLINYTSNFLGSIDGTANRDRVHLGDIQILEVVPEPSALLLLAVGGWLITCWRRRAASKG
ncbi:MAG: PEP-CTERM sorting domain-containing protein [Verrucomicrobiae bacterium]|nr:PEP-CTERM sorting domain-containing protein [Verrucomicrobiae bacterium]MDW8344099.1 PEP-CTERM sorting domain-containing protein [Verrucomicrobiae bacterium]